LVVIGSSIWMQDRIKGCLTMAR